MAKINIVYTPGRMMLLISFRLKFISLILKLSEDYETPARGCLVIFWQFQDKTNKFQQESLDSCNVIIDNKEYIHSDVYAPARGSVHIVMDILFVGDDYIWKLIVTSFFLVYILCNIFVRIISSARNLITATQSVIKMKIYNLQKN